MTQQSSPAEANASRSRPNDLLEISPAFSNLGSTTATRSWVALTAVVLVLVAAGTWGLFGKITLQESISAVSVSDGLAFDIATPVAGVVTRVSPVGMLRLSGDDIATVKPNDGGPEVTIAAPAKLLITTWETILGSPVEPGVPLGRGVLLGEPPEVAGLSTDDPLVAIAFVPIEDYQVLADAVSLEVSIPRQGQDPQTYEATLVSFATYSSSEDRIAQITGNPTYAATVVEETGGEAYLVALGFANSEDAAAVAKASQSGDPTDITSGQSATLVITKVSSNPLRVLFGSGA